MELRNLRLCSFVLYFDAFQTIYCLQTCIFPSFLQACTEQETCAWQRQVRQGHDFGDQCIDIRNDVMTLFDNPDYFLEPSTTRWTCVLAVANDRMYLIQHYDSSSMEYVSACIEFIKRSSSIVQVRWSIYQRHLPTDLSLCDDEHLKLDPWPMVHVEKITSEYVPSPLRGGFNMRITDSQYGESFCNYMHRPMKIEFECANGEGVLLDFLQSECTPDDLYVGVTQELQPAGAWNVNGDSFVVLRYPGENGRKFRFFCLRVSDVHGDHITAFLFTELVCFSGRYVDLLRAVRRGESPGDFRYLVLHLQRVMYMHLCYDDYPQCVALSGLCEDRIYKECRKTCGVCESVEPKLLCSFHEKLLGGWHRMTLLGSLQHVNITKFHLNITGELQLHAEDATSFRCFSSSRMSKKQRNWYALIAIFQNGCRPRFTCLMINQVNRISPYMTKSYVWPSREPEHAEDSISTTCRKLLPMKSMEHADPFKWSLGIQDAVVASKNNTALLMECAFSSYSLYLTSFDNSSCRGAIYRHCMNSKVMVIQLDDNCDTDNIVFISLTKRGRLTANQLHVKFELFYCLATEEDNYVEQKLSNQKPSQKENTDDKRMKGQTSVKVRRNILIQNIFDKTQTLCLRMTGGDNPNVIKGELLSDCMMRDGDYLTFNAFAPNRANYSKENYLQSNFQTGYVPFVLQLNSYPCRYSPLAESSSSCNERSTDNNSLFFTNDIFDIMRGMSTDNSSPAEWSPLIDVSAIVENSSNLEEIDLKIKDLRYPPTHHFHGSRFPLNKTDINDGYVRMSVDVSNTSFSSVSGRLIVSINHGYIAERVMIVCSLLTFSVLIIPVLTTTVFLIDDIT